MPEIELENVRVFDVLRNSLNGELTVVMGVSGDRLDLRDKTGAVVRFKFGPHFTRVPHDQAVDFREAVRAVRKVQQQNAPKKRRSVSGFLSRLAKKTRSR